MVEPEAGPSSPKEKVSPMLIGVQHSVLKAGRLPSKVGEARRFVINAGVASRSACGWPQMHSRKAAISIHPTSWCTQLAASELQSRKGLTMWV